MCTECEASSINRVDGPACDIVTDRVYVVLQDRPVVGLSPGVVDAIVAAGRDERALQLVTPRTSRLTMPLRVAFAGGDSRWVVRHNGERYFDGLTGEGLRWSGAAFVPHGAGVAAAVREGEPADHQLVLNVQLSHAGPPKAFGQVVETLCRMLAGGPPAGWGTGEPVAERWRPGELSALAAHRAPQPTLLVVVGGDPQRPMIGTLEIAPLAGGVLETATLAFGCPAGPRSKAEVAALAEALANGYPLTMFFAICRPGRPDLTCQPYEVGTAVPAGIAVGPEAASAAGAADPMALAGARQIGRAGRPTAWFDLSGGWDELTSIAGQLLVERPDV